MRYIFMEIGDGSVEECRVADSIGGLLRAHWLAEVRDAGHGSCEPETYEFLKKLLESRTHWPPGLHDLSGGSGGYGWYLLVVPDDGVAWKSPAWFRLHHDIHVRRSSYLSSYPSFRPGWA